MSKQKPVFKIKDYSVSNEEFRLIENSKYGFLETHPQPSEASLPSYYKSEDYISHTDTKRNLFEKAYHFVRSITLKKKLNLINSFKLQEKNLLDIGCGTGDFLATAKNSNWNVVGVEPNEDARKIANSKVDDFVYNVDELNKFQKQSFDVITLWHVLEHLPNIENQVQHLKKLLKENGQLVIAVPNHKSYDAEYYKEFWAAYDVPRHLWHFSKESVIRLFSEFKMEVEKTLPMKFDSFYVSLLSEKNKTGKMNPIKSFWIGLRSNLKANYTKQYSSLIYVIKNA